MKAPIGLNPIEYCIVKGNRGKLYVIRADEVATFTKWIFAKKGQRHFPADFEPFLLDSISNLRFTGWREETT